MAPSSHAANPQRARRVVRGKTVGLACTLFLACIGLANSDGSQHSLRQYRYVALRGGGGAAPSIPDLVADAATGLSLRDALLHTTAGTGQQPEDPGERPAGTLAGEAGAVRVEVTGRHCAGDIDPLCVSRSRNITLDGVDGGTIECHVILGPASERKKDKKESKKDCSLLPLGRIRRITFARLVADMQEARERNLPAMEIAGGRWELSSCKVEIPGGTAVVCLGQSVCVFSGCTVGGVGEGKERAAEGLAASGTSRVTFLHGSLRLCLAGVVARERSGVRLARTDIGWVSYGLMVDEGAQLIVRASNVSHVRQGVLVCGDDGAGARMSVRDSRLDGPLWYGGYRPGSLELRDNVLCVQRESPLQISAGRAEHPKQVVGGLNSEGLNWGGDRVGWGNGRLGEMPGGSILE